LIDATDIITLIEGSADKCEDMLYVSSCTSCGYTSYTSVRLQISYIPDPDLWKTFAEQIGEDPNVTFTTSEAWFHVLLANAQKKISTTSTPAINDILLEHHINCSQFLDHSIQFCDHLLPSWTLEINPLLLPKTLPSLRFRLKTCSGYQWFNLRAIIYTGSLHFTVHFIVNNIIWNYGGAKNNGQSYFEGNIDTPQWTAQQLLTFEGRDMYLLIYGC